MRRISEISNSFTKMQVAVNEFLSKAYRLALSGGNGGKESLQTEKIYFASVKPLLTESCNFYADYMFLTAVFKYPVNLSGSKRKQFYRLSRRT